MFKKIISLLLGSSAQTNKTEADVYLDEIKSFALDGRRDIDLSYAVKTHFGNIERFTHNISELNRYLTEDTLVHIFKFNTLEEPEYKDSYSYFKIKEKGDIVISVLFAELESLIYNLSLERSMLAYKGHLYTIVNEINNIKTCFKEPNQ